MIKLIPFRLRRNSMEEKERGISTEHNHYGTFRLETEKTNSHLTEQNFSVSRRYEMDQTQIMDRS